MTERIHLDLNKNIINSEVTVNALDQNLFFNMFASAILYVHRQQGSVFSRPGEDTRDAVSSLLKEQKLKPYEHIIEAMAEDYTAQLLEYFCPVKMPIEE